MSCSSDSGILKRRGVRTAGYWEQLQEKNRDPDKAPEDGPSN